MAWNGACRRQMRLAGRSSAFHPALLYSVPPIVRFVAIRWQGRGDLPKVPSSQDKQQTPLQPKGHHHEHRQKHGSHLRRHHRHRRRHQHRHRLGTEVPRRSSERGCEHRRGRNAHRLRQRQALERRGKGRPVSAAMALPAVQEASAANSNTASRTGRTGGAPGSFQPGRDVGFPRRGTFPARYRRAPSA